MYLFLKLKRKLDCKNMSGDTLVVKPKSNTQKVYLVSNICL